MPKLLVKFGISLADGGGRHPNGPLFHRWLPNGKDDAIIADLPKQKANIMLWFERLGYVDGYQIKFDQERREFDDSIMPRQTILDAGPLRGLITLSKVSKTQYEAVTKREVGSKDYEILGRMIVKQILEPQVSRLIAILRLIYGQFWLNWHLDSWDSRDMSLGAFCDFQNMYWSSDGGVTWHKFIPNKPELAAITIYGGKTDYSPFLNKVDWANIGGLFHKGFDPPFANQVLLRSHEMRSKGNLKYALVEAVTALEITLDWYFRSRLSTTFVDEAGKFSQLGVRSKIVLVSTLSDRVHPDDAEFALKGYDRRNKVVHEGLEEGDDASKLVGGILRMVAALLPEGPFKFPSSDEFNAVFDEESETANQEHVVEIGQPFSDE